MKIGGRVSSPTAAIKYIGNLQDSAVKAARMAVVESTLAIHKDAVELVSANEGGHRVHRSNPDREVTASDPFEPPHTDKGRLRQSIKFNIGATGETSEVGSNYKVASWLEFGTEDMAPRPWLSVAVEMNRKKIATIFVDFIEKGLK